MQSYQSQERLVPNKGGFLDKTPHFHGSSPVILEQNEDSTIEGGPNQQQQPNYESDTGMQEPNAKSTSRATNRRGNDEEE